MSAPLLHAQNLGIRFGGIVALSGLNLSVDRGETIGLIGPNGAGKSTVFNLLSGLYPPMSGSIAFRGQRIERLPADRRARLGIARTFQNNRLFERLSVQEHLQVTGCSRARLEELLGLFELRTHRALFPSALPYGFRKRLEIARALATGASLVLLDEPAAGLNDAETVQLRELLTESKRLFGLTLVIIEHDLDFVMRACSRVAVLNQGRIIAEGDPERVRGDARVIEAYLGVETPEAEA